VSQKAEPDSNHADFGANEWLVDELYEQYLKDKDAVDPAWWEFFEGYRPSGSTTVSRPAPTAPGASGQGAVSAPTAPLAAPAEPAVQAMPAVTAPAAASTPAAAPEPTALALTAPVATAQPATAPYAEVAAGPRSFCTSSVASTTGSGMWCVAATSA
jgi:2-oxoglutarate decarboxylase